MFASVLQWFDIVHLSCINNLCPLGGICIVYNGKKECLNGRNVDDLCEKYCVKKKCEIGISLPISNINCK